MTEEGPSTFLKEGNEKPKKKNLEFGGRRRDFIPDNDLIISDT